MGMKLVIVEDPANPELIAVANRNPDPRRVDVFVPMGIDRAITLPGGLILATDRPGAYLCLGQSCLPPITHPEELRQILRRS